jgi:hypothetical protein
MAWSSVVAAPDRRSSFRPDLAGQTKLRELDADLAESPPLIVAGADKQRSLRCAPALIITSCASLSLTPMI